MVSTVKTRPNHYETLGIEPEASAAEIGRAFAARMFSPHLMADAAQIGAAYEVLRNPARRKQYDEELGVGRAPPPPPATVSFRISARVAAEPREPRVEIQTRTEAHSERAVGSFIAQSLRAPAADAPQPRPEPEAQAPRPTPPRIDPPARSRVPVAALPEAEAGETGINRTVLAIGGTVLAVVVIGAWAGLEAGRPGDALPEKAAVSTVLPKAKPVTSVAAADPAPGVLDAAPPTPRSLAFAGLRTRHVRAPARAGRNEDRLAGVAQSLHHSYYETTAPDGTAEIAAADAPAVAPDSATAPVAATQASLPLSNQTVARTIGRIGYACGSVASTSAVDGSPGVFKITCSSGHSYQATPVRGRYHFRRVSN